MYRLFERGGPDPVNVGNDGERTVRELADIVTDLVGSESSVVVRPLPTDDPKQRRPDLGLARRTLDWYPTVSLEEGLSRTVEYFKEVI